MVNPNELRIGNYVFYKNNEIEVQTIDDGGINEDRDGPVDEGGSLYRIKRGLSYEDIDHIPLTVEWLERCGFTWDKGYMKINLKHARMALGFYAGVSDKMSLFQTTIPGEGSVEHEIGFGSNHPECIHQLQNPYFALTGEELTIKS